jgi:tRNA modification GTPase
MTGEGLEGLVADLAGFARTMAGGVGDLVATRERQRVHLAETLAALRDARRETRPLELRAEDLRRAGDALGRIAGRMGVEDLLDVIFGEFCIGK